MNSASNIYKKLFLTFILYSLFLIPIFASAQVLVDLTPCDGPDCGFDDLMVLVERVMDFIVRYLVIPGATISFAIAGWTILTNADNAGKRKDAYKMMTNVVKGLVVLLAAWLIVKTVLGVFLKPEVIQQVPIQNL